MEETVDRRVRETSAYRNPAGRGLPAPGAALFAAGLAVTFFAVRLNQLVSQEMVTRHQREQLISVSHQVSRLRVMLEYVRSELVVLGDRLGDGELTPDLEQLLVRRFAKSHPDLIAWLFVRDSAGNTKIAAGPTGKIHHDRGPKKPALSWLFSKPKVAGHASLMELEDCYSVVVYAPIPGKIHDQGEIGLLIRPDALGKWFRKAEVTADGFQILLDADGRILYHPEAIFIGEHLEQCPGVLSNGTTLKANFFKENNTGIADGPLFMGAKHVFASWSFPIGEHSCSLISCSPYASVSTFLTKFSRMADVLAGLALAVIALSLGYVAYLFSSEKSLWQQFNEDLQQEIGVRQRVEAELRTYRDNLEERVQERTEELTRMTREAQVARQAAEMANSAKSTFLTNVSHELRTPLNAIIGYGELLEEELTESDKTDLLPDLKRILSAGEHLSRLIADILDVARLEVGKVRLRPEELDVSQVIHDVVDTIRPLSDANGNNLKLDLNEDLGMMYCDATRLRQCLFNVLSNAFKFTRNGIVTLAAERETVETTDWLLFSVRDTGIGMTPDQLDTVFDMFMQADNSPTRDHGGVGLGLPITRGLCQLMGGTIEAQSTPEGGSMFTIRLPARMRELPADLAPLEEGTTAS